MIVKLFMCGGEHNRLVSEIPLGIGYMLTNTLDAKLVYVKDWKDLQGADIIGLSSNAWGLPEAHDIASRMKVTSPSSRIVLGGQGTLWKPLEDFNAHHFDNIVHGDGERALQAIVAGHVPAKTVVEKRVEDIDTLKFPERGRCKASVPIITSRGCPYNCAFCTSRAQWGKPRLRSVDNLAAEIEYLLGRYKKMTELYILDDLWAYPQKRFDEFYSWWMSHKMNKRLSVRGFVRSNMVTKDLLLKMKRMGFSRVRFGAETASPRLLKAINKGATVEDHQRAIDLAQEVGLPITASFMRKLPGETREDRKLTQKFLVKNKGKLRIEGNYEFKPFPGCALYKGESPLKFDMRVR